MLNRFTNSAKLVLVRAQEEAHQLRHNVVGTEHLLLGLMRVEDTIGARVLENLGFSLDSLREKVKEMVGVGTGFSASLPPQALAITPRVKRIFELAMAQSQAFGHNYIGPEHLLLGLIHEGEGVACQVIKAGNVSLKQVQDEVLSQLQRQPQNQVKFNQVKSGQPAAGKEELQKYGRDLTELAKQGKIDPVIGRDREISRVIQILTRRTKNNPVLIGEPGVGKTAIAEGLAQRIIEGKVPELLRGKRLFSLDIGSMVAGTKYRGEFEERLKKVIKDITESGEMLLFVDELHTIVGAGGAEGAIDASNMLKPALARGELQLIGATTLDEYRKYVEKDAALERRFQPIQVDEPTVEETIEILKGVRDKYEAHHKVKITDEALEQAAVLSDRYISDRFLPDKAIDLIDEAASKIRLENATTPPDLKSLEQQLEDYSKEKQAAVEAQDFEKAAELRDKEKEVQAKLSGEKEAWEKDRVSKHVYVSEEDIATIVSEWTGIPVMKLAETESERLLKLEEILHQRVIGQDEAVKAVAKAVRRARAGLKDPRRPVGSFIFLGPTGVGKTELAKALAQALFGDQDAMIRIDMSEYMERHAVSRLVGSPPGYVGYDEGGQLTENVRRKPYSVVLLDEIEKAHPEVFNILLQVLEDGRLTDGQGRTVDFRNTVVIMTSNVGASTINRSSGRLGFHTGSEESVQGRYAKMKENVIHELRRTFRPEFLNRIDETIVFHALEAEHIHAIVSLMLKEVEQRLDGMHITLEVTPEAKQLLADLGHDLEFGARPLRRVIRQQIEDELSEWLLRQDIVAGQHVKIDAIEKAFKFDVH